MNNAPQVDYMRRLRISSMISHNYLIGYEYPTKFKSIENHFINSFETIIKKKLF